VDWIHVTQDTGDWRAFVDTAVNLRVPQKTRDFVVAERLLVSEELCNTNFDAYCFYSYFVLQGHGSIYS
jgi:hypothetical protein